ncbi:MAG: glycoside hydrolase [Chromatiales bacterium]|nr:glycoside hydrolase [Chromatiales bacterium]
MALVLFALVDGGHSVRAAAVDHSHHQHTTSDPAAPCTAQGELPDLRCAKSVTAALDGEGGLWVAWVSGGHIYLQSSPKAGSELSRAVVVNRQPERISAGNEHRPKIAFGRDGRIYIAWTEKLAKRFSGHIRFAWSDDRGASFSTPLTVNDHLEVTSHRFESMVVDARGHIHLTWLDKRDRLAAEIRGEEYRGAALYHAVSTDNGVSFSVNKKLADNSCECCRIAMAIDPQSGLPLVVWRHIYGDNIRDHGLVRLNENGEWGEQQRLSYSQWQTSSCPHHGPSLAASSEAYHAVWFANGAEQSGLFYSRVDRNSLRRLDERPVGSAVSLSSHPSVVTMGERVYIAWLSYDGKESHVLIQASPDGGESWQAPATLASHAGGTDYPFLLSDGERLYLSWHRAGEPYQLVRVTK